MVYEPDVCRWALVDEIELLVLATDGIWDSLKEQFAAQRATDSQKCEDAFQAQARCAISTYLS